MVRPTEETFAAMRWATQLTNDVAVLSLIRSLPKEIVEEEVPKYQNNQKRAETAVAARAKENPKIDHCMTSTFNGRMLVARRFYT